MSKDAHYFSHDYNAHNDPKLVKLSMQGWDLVGLYWAVIGMLHEQGGDLSNDPDTIAFALRADKERIATLINFNGLFRIKGDKFSCDRVIRNIEERKDKSEKARI